MTKLFETCPTCGEEIDPDLCYCGDYVKDHGWGDGHAPVPYGCVCFYHRGVASKPSQVAPEIHQFNPGDSMNSQAATGYVNAREAVQAAYNLVSANSHL